MHSSIFQFNPLTVHLGLEPGVQGGGGAECSTWIMQIKIDLFS